jgi:hypothetical protein
LDKWEGRRKTVELMAVVGSLFGVAVAVHPIPELFPQFPLGSWVSVYLVAFILSILFAYSGAIREDIATYSNGASLLAVVFGFALSMYLTAIDLQPLVGHTSEVVLGILFVAETLIITVFLNWGFRRTLGIWVS